MLNGELIEVSANAANAGISFAKFGKSIGSLISAVTITAAISAGLMLLGKGIEAFYNNVIKKHENIIKRGKEAQ